MSVFTQSNRQIVADFASAMRPKTIVEVGIRDGRLSALLLQVPTLKHLFMIDSWEVGGEFHHVYELYSTDVLAAIDNQEHGDISFAVAEKERAARVKHRAKRWAKNSGKAVTVYHMRSTQAVFKFSNESIDLFYTDGDHSFKGVTADIESYYHKVRVGGIISGDDYIMPSVRDAVDRLLPHRQIHKNGRLWWAYRQ